MNLSISDKTPKSFDEWGFESLHFIEISDKALIEKSLPRGVHDNAYQKFDSGELSISLDKPIETGLEMLRSVDWYNNDKHSFKVIDGDKVSYFQAGLMSFVESVPQPNATSHIDAIITIYDIENLTRAEG